MFLWRNVNFYTDFLLQIHHVPRGIYFMCCSMPSQPTEPECALNRLSPLWHTLQILPTNICSPLCINRGKHPWACFPQRYNSYSPHWVRWHLYSVHGLILWHTHWQRLMFSFNLYTAYGQKQYSGRNAICSLVPVVGIIAAECKCKTKRRRGKTDEHNGHIIAVVFKNRSKGPTLQYTAVTPFMQFCLR